MNKSLAFLNNIKIDQNSVEFVIEVDDTGKGISREKQKSAFEDFVQVKGTSLEHAGFGINLPQLDSVT
ncbi:hypothetical protein IFM89_026247 [Coptis chinensis]|uniref:Histidine kinase/HSP90-like ATPase domain-containing protein n=1 Tax=Coptis chinensis TaxID=261450 RepID=A0A835HY64_9MAGN|nr:hypothetical protein IFM89_026247 [Coptis chinensis]